MRAPSTFMLAALALSVSRAFAADVAAPASVVTDSGGNPVTNSAGECWRSSGMRGGISADCRRSGASAAANAGSGVAPSTAGAGNSQSALASGAGASGNAQSAAAGPGLIDSNGQPVGNGFGQCWGTGFSAADCPQSVAGAAAVAGPGSAPAAGGTDNLQSGSTSSAGAAGNMAGETAKAGLVDSNGQPVRSSYGECWGTGFSRADCPQTVAAAAAAAAPAAVSGTASAGKIQPESSSGAGGAANAASAVAAAGLVDSNGQPVRSGFGECWGTSFSGPSPANCVTASGTQAASVAAPSTSRGTAATAAAPAAVAAGAAATTASATGPAMAKGNPGYLTDSNGYVVRSGAGDCWHTGSWTPALANVVGCDGVLARAAPVPAPAPSPKPQPPAESVTEAPSTVQPSAALPETPSVPATPVVPGESAETPPAAIAPSEATPPAAVAPSESGSEAPALVAPSPPPAAQAEIAPPAAEPSPPASEPSPPPSAAERQPRSEKVTLDTDTYFDFDKATLKPEGERKLKELASRLASMKLEVVVATGHTDWTGTDAYNQKLSERRAQAVKRFLTQQGLPGDRIFTEGKGEKQPVASNRTREGRAKNRRVEVELVGTRSR